MKQRAAKSTDLALEVQELAATLTRMRLQAAIDFLSDPEKRATLRPEDLDSIGRVIDPAGLAAAAHLLDRGHGKPKPPPDDTRFNALEGVGDDELDDWIIAEAPAAIARVKGRRK